MIYLGAANPSINTQYLFIIMTERGGTIIFCRILAPPQCLPPPHIHTTPTPQYLFILMGVMIFCRILALIPPQTPQYLTILKTEKGRHYVCRILAPPIPPPSHDATILNYLNDRGRGRHYFFIGFWRPQCPPSPGATILNNLNDS